jgi:hypothetical protein
MSTALLPLSDLATRINAEHAACIKAATDAIARSIEVGRLLEQAKEQVRHGEWSAWVEANCSFGIRMAQNYVRTYENRSTLEAEMRNGVSHLTSLRGAIRHLAEPAAKQADPPQDNHSVTAREQEQDEEQDEAWSEREWRAQSSRAPVDADDIDDWIKKEIADENEWIKAKVSARMYIKISLDYLVDIRKALRDIDKTWYRNFSIHRISRLITIAREQELAEQERERWRIEQEEWFRQIEEKIRRTAERLNQLQTGTSSTYSENLKVLGLVPPVTRHELRTAYLDLAKIHHPDRGGDSAEFQRVQRAYSEATRQMSGEVQPT